jgi:hypothetical protein
MHGAPTPSASPPIVFTLGEARFTLALRTEVRLASFLVSSQYLVAGVCVKTAALGGLLA